MKRPTRQTKNLERKLASKKTHSRKSGQKARRWKRALDRANGVVAAPAEKKKKDEEKSE